MSWTEERVELLRKLWTEGLSASRVAAELGGGITRNAVIGKIHRLGLAERDKTPKPFMRNASEKGARKPNQQANEADQSAETPAVMGNVALALAPLAEAAPAPAAQRDVVIPITQRVTLMELRESMCRWPMGDPSNSEFRFCGARSPAGSGPYCATHARLAYQPVQDRRRLREPARAARSA